MDPITSATLAETLGGLAVEALKPVFGRVARMAGLGRPTFYEEYRRLLGAGAPRPSVLSLYNALPAGVNLRELSEILQSASAVATVRQLTAVHIMDAESKQVKSYDPRDQDSWDKRQERTHKAFVRFLTDALDASYDFSIKPSDQPHGVADLNRQRIQALSKCADAAFDVLDEYTVMASDYLTRNSKYQQSAVSWAQKILADASLEAIARYAEMSAGISTPSLAERKRWLNRYRTIFAAKHRTITLPDLNTRNSIDYEKLYVRPSLCTKNDSEIGMSSLLDDFDHVVILGDPGAGKSTLSNVIAMTCVKQYEIVPFHITMREVNMSSTGFSVIQEVETRLTYKYQLEPMQNVVEQLLIEGAAVLIFDGLDELLDPTARREAAEIIELTCKRFPLARVIVTCRQIGYSQARLSPRLFEELTIHPFDDVRVREYVSKWLAVSNLFMQSLVDDGTSGKWSIDDSVSEFMNLSSSISDMRGNPLLLSFICVMYRGRRYIPRNRPQLFDKCVDLLLRAWDVARGITRAVADESYELALAEVADFIMSRAEYRTGIPEGVLKDVFAENLAKDAGYSYSKARATAAIMVSHCEGRAWIFSDVGLTSSGEKLYAFTHSSFQEYFRAWSLIRTFSNPEMLAHELGKLLKDGRSQITVQIAVHLCDQHVKNGGSLCLYALLDSIIDIALSGGDPISALDIVREAADAVQLQQNVISKLCKCVLQQAIVPSQRSPAEMLKLLSPDFRHSDGVRSVFPEVVESLLGSGDDESQLRLGWLATNASLYMPTDMGWAETVFAVEKLDFQPGGFDSLVHMYASRSDLAWQLGLRRGLLSVAAIDQLESRQLFTKLFEKCDDWIARVGEEVSAVWIFRVLGAPRRNSMSDLHSVRILRLLGSRITPDGLSGLTLRRVSIVQNRRSIGVLLEEGVIDRALRRLAGYDVTVRQGLAYLTLAALDFFGRDVVTERDASLPQRYESGYRQAYEHLTKGAESMLDSFEPFFKSWRSGTLWEVAATGISDNVD